MTRMPAFEIYEGEDGQSYARIRASNGRIIWQSEGYVSKQSAEDAIFMLIGWVNAQHYRVKDLTLEDAD